MEWLIRQVKIVDNSSPFNQQIVDLHLVDDQIAAIAPHLEITVESTIELAGCSCSPGWVDVGALLGDPGHEDREDIYSLTAAAAKGGYTTLAPLPNTDPVVDRKAAVRYLIERSANTPVHLHPLGALSAGCAGQDITEMMDMRAAGAIAFTDGLQPIQQAGLLLRALQYTQTFDGLILNRPHDQSIATNGQLHEGRISTQLGLPGIPVLAEQLMVERDLRMLEYAGGRLHLFGLSSAAAVAQVRRAKQAGLAVSASVPALNLLYDHEALSGYDTNFKVLPPLREASDREALIAGIQDGTIDLILSNHQPYERESKLLEYPYAQFGAAGLETAFALAQTALQTHLSTDRLVDVFCHRARQLLGLPSRTIELGAPAELSFFEADTEWTVSLADLRSKSTNNPLIGKTLRGKIRGIFNKGRWWEQ